MIDILLSYAQVRFCKVLIEELGAKLHGFTLTFEGLDDLTHFQRKLYGIRTKTTKDYITMTAVSRKLDAAMKKQQGSLLMKTAPVFVTKVEGGFLVGRKPCPVCGEEPFGAQYCCDCKRPA